MTRHRTFRVLATKTETFFIDLAASAEVGAISRAKSNWYGPLGCRFQRCEPREVVTFGIDEESSIQLCDIANEDRAGWAKAALQAFSKATGSEMGREALHDLLSDLGHYARSAGIDFRDEMDRAADVCSEEIEAEARS